MKQKHDYEDLDFKEKIWLGHFIQTGLDATKASARTQDYKDPEAAGVRMMNRLGPVIREMLREGAPDLARLLEEGRLEEVARRVTLWRAQIAAKEEAYAREVQARTEALVKEQRSR